MRTNYYTTSKRRRLRAMRVLARLTPGSAARPPTSPAVPLSGRAAMHPQLRLKDVEWLWIAPAQRLARGVGRAQPFDREHRWHDVR